MYYMTVMYMFCTLMLIMYLIEHIFLTLLCQCKKRYLIQAKLWILMKTDVVCGPVARGHHYSYSVHCSLQK